MEAEEGGGAGEEAGVEVEHAGEEEQPHFLVLLLWEALGPELELFGLAGDRKQQRENNLLKTWHHLAHKYNATRSHMISNNLSIPRQ